MGERAGEMMERDRPENTSREEYVVRPGETHVVRGATPSAREEVSGLQSSEVGATTAGTAGSDEEPRTEEIRADIEQTRAELSETIDAIQEKLAPDTLKEQAKEVVRDATVGRAEQALGEAQETVRGAGTGIMDMIKQNPIPVAMVGLGLGWLWFNRQRQSSESDYQRGYYAGPGRGSVRYGETRARGSRYGAPGYRETPYSPRYYEEYESEGGRGPQERVGEMAGRAQGRVRDMAGEAQGRASEVTGRAQETVGELAGRTGETAGQFADRAQETVGELTGQARYQMERARGGFQQQLMENPFALGALALGLGVAVGLAVPETRREDELLGEARDNLLSQAQSAMQDTGQRVQRVAERVQQDVQQDVREETQSQS